MDGLVFRGEGKCAFCCVVMVSVGTRRFRMTVDTRAARSGIRTSFAEQLHRSPSTRGAVARGCCGEGKVGGGQGEMVALGRRGRTDVLRLGLRSDQGANGLGDVVWTEVEFGEVEEAASGLVLGSPETSAWGAMYRRDEEGHAWVEFQALGVALLAVDLDPTSETLCRLRVIEPQVLEGPVVWEVPAYFEGSPRGERVLDDGWSGVRVLGKSLRHGRQTVQVVVDSGRRVVITPLSCPWRVGGAGGDQWMPCFGRRGCESWRGTRILHGPGGVWDDGLGPADCL